MSLSDELSLDIKDVQGESSVLFGNVAGLYPRTNKLKVKLLAEKAYANNACIIAVTESHLKSYILDAEIHIAGYHLYRSDRIDEINKGGVIVYIKEEYAQGVKILSQGCNGTVEWICLYLPKVQTVFVNIYRPPSCDEKSFGEALIAMSDGINSQNPPMPTVFVCGDFNLPMIDWSLGLINSSTLIMRRQAEALMEFMGRFNLQQCITAPTRVNNILDLFLTNNRNLICQISVLDTVISDHRIILVGTYMTVCKPAETERYISSEFNELNFNHENIDWEKVDSELSQIDWPLKLVGSDPSAMLETMSREMLAVSVKYVPANRSRVRKSIIPRERRIIMRKRTRINKQIQRATGEKRNSLCKQLDLLEFKLYESHKRDLHNEEARAVSTIKNNPKYFFSYAKKKSKIKVPIGPLNIEGKMTSCNEEVANVLQDQFQSVFSTPKHRSTNIDSLEEQYDCRFNSLDVSEADIEKAIGKISVGSAAGNDGIPPVLLKKCVSSLKKPLCLLWKESIRSSKIPESMKMGLIIPVFKSGDRCEARNYRPVTLTSHLIKVVERVIVEKLVAFLEENNLFNERQHGFRSNRSCLSQLMDHYQHILNILEEGGTAEVIYLDFAKAFDKVDHGILVRKMMAMGVGGVIVRWIQEFLEGRKQAVRVRDNISLPADVVSGVPQGTVLGPLLFLIFVADIDKELVYARASSFADDTRVVLSVSCSDDQLKLQQDLETIYQWTETNNMMFNSTKFQRLQYSAIRDEDNNAVYFSPGNEPIETTPNVKDLGVLMSATCSFDAHINERCAKGSQMCGWIYRTFTTRNTECMMVLFRALVLPVMEYCCQLWCPRLQRQIKAVDNVQRHFTAQLPIIAELPYWKRLKHLRIYSLERRRERYLIIYVWKIIQGLAPNLLGEDMVELAEYSQRRGRFCRIPSLNWLASASVRTLKENSFCVFGPRLFNMMPRHIRDFEGSLPTFKRKIDEYLTAVIDDPLAAGGNGLLWLIPLERARRVRGLGH